MANYNGWTNRATWCVNLHGYDELAREFYEDNEWKWSKDEMQDAVNECADYLGDYFWERLDELEVDDMYRDLIDTDINFYEIAYNALDEEEWDNYYEDEEEEEEDD